MGNNQSSSRGGRSTPQMTQRRRERTHSGGTAMEVDSVVSNSVATGNTSGTVSPVPETEADSQTSSEADPGMQMYASTHSSARRKRYQESTSTSSTRSGSSTTPTDQKPSTGDRPSIGRRISSAFGKRKTERRTSPFASRGESSLSGLDKGKQRETPSSSAPLETTQEEEQETTRRDRGSRGQGEMKRRRISGTFSATPSRTNSDTALASRTQCLSTDENSLDQEEAEQTATAMSDVDIPPRSATLVEEVQLDSSAAALEQENVPEADETDPAATPLIPSGVPGSPPVIPLTEADPLLDDRLRTLSTIWEVLGSNVARSLPAVATAEAVRRASVTGSVRSREAIVEGLSTPSQEFEPVIPDADLASLPALPPSTVSLLDDLAADARERAAAAQGSSPLEALLGGSTTQVPTMIDSELPAIVIPPTPDTRSEQIAQEPPQTSSADGLLHPPPAPTLMSRPSASSLLSTATATTEASTTSGQGSTANASQERRRSRIGGLAERVGSWFGIGGADGNPESDRAQSVGSAQSLPAVPNETPTTAPDPTPSVPTPSPPARLPQGAVMIVQGFVQTSISASQGNDHGEDSSEGDEGPLTTSLPLRPDGPPRTTSTQQATPATLNTETPEEPSQSRPGTPRRASEGDQPRNQGEGRASRAGRGGIFGRYRSSATAEPPNFTDQARMLAGLLSVATAATASSLLALPAGTDAAAAPAAGITPPAPASGPRATLAALRRRLQNSNANNAPPATEETGLESVLRSYMQRAMNGNTMSATANGDTAGDNANNANSDDDHPALATILPDAEEASFEEFLNNMQYSLIRSLREFNGDPSLREVQATASPAVAGADATSSQENPTLSETNETPAAPLAEGVGSTNRDPSPVAMEVDNDQASVHSSGSINSGSHITEADADEQPPRLSFFRMFQFPARDQPAPTTAPGPGESPAPTSLIPAVIVGVRSISRDISTITGQTASQAPFPFSDAADMQDHADDTTAAPATTTDVPTATRAALATPTPGDDNVSASADVPAAARATNQADATGTTASDTDAQAVPTNRMMRVIRALVQRDGQRARQAEAQAAARAAAFVTNNYVIWVVGGNYPAGHPILTIPHLFTGELNHEDLWALAEAMGQAKPPVATKDDIAKAGLKVIKGSEIETAVKAGQVHDMCLDRCLVCLSDYEPEEDCRVMTCKHAFHVECIDRWLETGRNSCPACRQAGVETASNRETSTAAAPDPGPASNQDGPLAPVQTTHTEAAASNPDHDATMA